MAKTRGGTSISLQQAKLSFGKIKEKNEQLKSEGIDKFTCKIVLKKDEEILTENVKYSTKDAYMYHESSSENIFLYNEQENGNKEHTGIVHYGVDYTYKYIDKQGRFLSVNEYWLDGSYKDEKEGIFTKNVSSEMYYKIEAETREASIQAFNDSDWTRKSDILEKYLAYSTQMVYTFQSFLGGGTPNSKELYNVEYRSKGDGHLLLTQNMMPIMGTYTECEYNNNILTYVKVVLDYEKMGIVETDYSVITEEIWFSYNKCEVTYPDLKNYKLYE